MIKTKKFDISNIFHKSFKLGILLKAIDGTLEIIGGLLLMSLNPERLNKLIVLLTQRELSEDPRDIIANYIIKLSSRFTISAQYFGVFYLVTHGLIKVILVILLWKRKIWAYPVTIVILVLFVIYQIYRYTYSHSLGLILLTVLDIVVIVLAFVEFIRLKHDLLRK